MNNTKNNVNNNNAISKKLPLDNVLALQASGSLGEFA